MKGYQEPDTGLLSSFMHGQRIVTVQSQPLPNGLLCTNEGSGRGYFLIQAGYPKWEGHLLLLVKKINKEQHRNRPGLGHCACGAAEGAHDFSPAQRSV